MNNGVQNKDKAIQLRKLGSSYGEIITQTGVSKATVANWVRGINLTQYQRSLLDSRLKLKQKRGRFNAGIALRARRVYREKSVFDEAEKIFKTLINDSFFVYGLSLCSGQYPKKTSNFQFTSQDPEILSLMIFWIKKYIQIQKGDLNYRLFSYLPYKDDNHESFWAHQLELSLDQLNPSVYRPIHFSYKKKTDYRGSLCITISDIRVLRTVLAWQKLVIKYYRETVTK